jgi:hypothetical protein
MGKMTRDPKVGRAEAMRHSMLTLIDKGTREEAHPAFWAPFVVVGEGVAARWRRQSWVIFLRSRFGRFRSEPAAEEQSTFANGLSQPPGASPCGGSRSSQPAPAAHASTTTRSRPLFRK